MNSENYRLEKLLEERKQIENRIKQIQAKKNSQKRKFDTRRKILFRVMLEKLIVEGRVENETITKLIDEHLKTERDRDLVKNYLTTLKKSDLKPLPSPPLLNQRGKGQGLGISRPAKIGKSNRLEVLLALVSVYLLGLLIFPDGGRCNKL